MSINIRYLTNGTKAIYSVMNCDVGRIDNYDSIEEIPYGIRHYAPKGEPMHIDFDTARMLGVLEVLYPNYPKCSHPKYEGKVCLDKGCNYSEEGYSKCQYFKGIFNKVAE